MPCFALQKAVFCIAKGGLLVINNINVNFLLLCAVDGSVSKSVSGRNSKKGPAKILTGPNKFVILGDKT